MSQLFLDQRWGKYNGIIGYVSLVEDQQLEIHKSGKLDKGTSSVEDAARACSTQTEKSTKVYVMLDYNSPCFYLHC